MGYLCLLGPRLAQADEAPAVIHDYRQMPSGNYTLDQSHAHLLFFISHLGFSSYEGEFKDFDADLKFDAKHPESSELKVTIAAKSVTVDSDSLTDDLRSDDFFDVEHYPQITFVAHHLKRIDAQHGEMTGDVTLLGVTKPLTFQVEFIGGGYNALEGRDTLGFHAKAKLKRSDFGMTKYIPIVGDEVELMIMTEFGRVETAPRSKPTTH